MLETKIPPHISIACFSTNLIEPIIDMISENLSTFKTGKIAWPSLGMFPPGILFAAPVLNEYLQNACIDANRLVEPLSAVGERGLYLPYNWVPHTTLACQLGENGLIKAVDAALGQFSFIAGKTNRLQLAVCNPYIEVKTWDLM
jgi:hypothetical protein